MFCTKCGSKLDDGASFCYNCGVSVVKNTYTSTDEEKYTNDTAEAEFVGTEASGDFIDDDVEALIGVEKRIFYINRFAEMKQKNKKATWNWCAFLFGPAWMIYRKMYVYGAALWLLEIVLGELPAVLDLTLSVLLGVFGNYIYMMYLEKLSAEAKALQEPNKSEFIKKNGGTSATAVFVGMGVLMTLSFVGSLVFGGLFI